MVRFSRLFTAVVVLGVLCVIPALAKEGLTQVSAEATGLVLSLDDPLFTPMDGHQQGVITVEDLRRIHFLRACDPPEVQAYCPGCSGCIISNNIPYCYGC